MDHLLQEELQLAKANHQQTVCLMFAPYQCNMPVRIWLQNASQTSRLSSHYSTLLAQREAVIEELATQETDLKHALQEKAIKESQLKEDKTLLLTANKVLQDRLDTTLRSESTSGLSSTAEGGGTSGGTSEEDGMEDPAPLHPSEDVGREEEGEGLGTEQSIGEGVASPDSNLQLNMMQELSDDEHKEIKYFPPNR